jgi:hypothetical protein
MLLGPGGITSVKGERLNFGMVNLHGSGTDVLMSLK